MIVMNKTRRKPGSKVRRKVRSHRFQSSREVFDEYIPGYKDRRSEITIIGERDEASRAGIALATELVEKLKHALVN